MIRALVVVAVVALAALAALLGHRLGTAAAADQGDAAVARERAAAAAYAQANLTALAGGLSRGNAVGAAAGAELADDLGEQRGSAAAERMITRSVATGPQPLGGGTVPLDLDGAGEVLVVGDSLEVGTSPYIGAYLPGVRVTSSAEVGYTSDEIRGLFEGAFRPAQSVIVFDAGTNDNPATPQILAGNLEAVAAAIGNRGMVVPTVNGPTFGGVDSSGLNRVIERFAAARPGTQVPDWAGLVRAHPELLQPDGIHATPQGYDVRAGLVADGVRACLDGGESFFSP